MSINCIQLYKISLPQKDVSFLTWNNIDEIQF